MKVLLRPRLIVLHLLVLLVVLILGRLGLWQVSRLGEAQARNDAAVARFAEAPIAVDELLAGVSVKDTVATSKLEYRPVTAVGSWRPEDEVLQRGRSHSGLSGFYVLTPFDLDGGKTVLVLRGSIPFDNDLLPPVVDAPPPAGTVTLNGWLERSIPQPTSGIAQRDPDVGELDLIFNADIARLESQLGGAVLPMILHLDEQSPASDHPLPLLVERPILGNGSHLSYAVQWFSFATIGAGMYLLWLRRRVRGDERAKSREA